MRHPAAVVTLDVSIAAHSGIARGVYALSSSPTATLRVNVDEITGPALNRRAALKPALELHFLRIDGETVRFLHPIIQTYLASRGMELVRRAGLADPEWGPLLEVGATDEVLRALRMYATRLALAGGAAEEERVGLLMRDLVP